MKKIVFILLIITNGIALAQEGNAIFTPADSLTTAPRHQIGIGLSRFVNAAFPSDSNTSAASSPCPDLNLIHYKKFPERQPYIAETLHLGYTLSDDLCAPSSWNNPISFPSPAPASAYAKPTKKAIAKAACVAAKKGIFGSK